MVKREVRHAYAKLAQPKTILVYCVFGGFLTGSIFAYGTPVLLGMCGIFPLIITLAEQKLLCKERILAAVSFFLPFHFLVLSWFLQADISGLSGVNHATAWKASFASLLIMTIVLTLCMLPLAGISHYFAFKLRRTHFLLLVLPAGWVVCEWLRSMGMAIFLYGKGASIGDYWNFGSLGLGLMNTPLDSLSRIVGMYGLTFISFFFAGAILLLIGPKESISKNARVRLLTILILLVVSGLTIQFWPAKTSTQHIGSVLQIGGLNPDYTKKIRVANSIDHKKDLIVLPEYSGMFVPGYEQFAEQNVNRRLSSKGISVDVDEGLTHDHYATLEFRDNTGKLRSQQTKELLIPTGEYLPWIVSSFYNATNQRAVVEHFNTHRLVKKGTPARTVVNGDLSIGPVSCSGILSRNLYRQLTNQGSNVLTNSASLVIFNKSPAYFRQSLLMAKFHAVANSRTFIQATKSAPAFVLDQKGRFIVEPGGINDQFIDFNFAASSNRTFYTRVGEWMLWFSIVSLAGAFVYSANKYGN